MPGRHRKAAPHRARWAGLAAATTLALTAAVPAVAVLGASGGPPGGADRGTSATSASGQSRQAVTRAATRTVSRSASRLPQAELLDGRIAASEQALELAALLVRQEQRERRERRQRLEKKHERAKGFLDVPGGVSLKPCPDGSSVESGLQPNAVKVYRAVCAAFPAVSSWGGRSGGGKHGMGLALDIMVSGEAGDRVAAYVRENAGRLGVSEVIFARRIWTVERAGEGWRSMEDRGSVTANHYDHVHVTVF